MASALLAINDSLSAPMTFSMEVEPSVATVPVIAVLVLSSLVLSAFASVLVSVLLPQAARVSTAASSSAINFFIRITSLFIYISDVPFTMSAYRRCVKDESAAV